jgi:hypothetical protein
MRWVHKLAELHIRLCLPHYILWLC